MKKLAVLLLILYCFSLFGCTAPMEPTEPTETKHIIVDVWSLQIGSLEIFYDWYNRVADNDPPIVPANMILYNSVLSLGDVGGFERPIYSDKDNYYYWYDIHYVFGGRLYCYHDGAKNHFPEDDPALELFEPASISAEMTDMSKIPANGKRQVITRNGFHYLYKADGNIEAIEWYIDNIRLRFVFKRVELDTAPYTTIPNLLSMDDNVAFAAMDEIVNNLGNGLPAEFPHNQKTFSYFMESMDADQRRQKRPRNIVTWDNVAQLAEGVYNFEFLNEEFTQYRYGIKHCIFDGCMEFTHSDSESAQDSISGYIPTSISDRMTDMLRIPSNGESRYVISRNGFDYFYNKDGNLERIEWKSEDITCSLSIYSIHQAYLDKYELNDIDEIIHHMYKAASTVLFELLSVSDDVAFEAMDEITDRMRLRKYYTQQKITTKSTPAQ